MSICVDCWIRLFCPEERSENHAKRRHLSMKLHGLTPQGPINVSFRYDEYLSNYTGTVNVAVSWLTPLLGMVQISVLYLRLETFCPNRTSVVVLSYLGVVPGWHCGPLQNLSTLSSTVLVFHAFVWNSASPSVIHK
jgi:hypothetical protein